MRRTVAMLLALSVGGYGSAQELADPTRPPADHFAEAGAPAVELSLQSVILPVGGRPLAVISGRTVRLGDPVGEGRLARLTETEAVIRGPGGLRRLRLTPAAEKTDFMDKKAAGAAKTTKGRP